MFGELGIGDLSASPAVGPLSNGSAAGSGSGSSPAAGAAPLSLEEKQRRARQQEAAARLSSQPRLTSPSAASPAPAPAPARQPRDLTDSLISSNLNMMARPPAPAAFHGPAPGYRLPNGAGFPQQQAGFPQQQSGFPQQPAGFPQQQSGFPQQHSGFPQQQSGFPQQQPALQQQQQQFGMGGPMIGAPGFGLPALPPAPSVAGWSQQQRPPAQFGLGGPPAAAGSGFSPQYGQPTPSKQLSANEISDLLS